MKKKTSESLLSQFMDQRIKEYVEPQKKGCSKGDAIGFSSEKFSCAIFFLTNMRQREIASMFNTTHETLRYWNTQKKFKRVVDDHCQDFLKEALKKIDSLMVDDTDKENLLRKNFSDSSKYSRKLRKTFFDWAEKNLPHFTDDKDTEYVKNLNRFYTVNQSILNLSFQEMMGLEGRAKISEKMVQTAVDEIEKIIIIKKPICEGTRDKILFLLGVIREASLAK